MLTKAVFAGSFNPFTLGHYDIAVRAASLCENLIIGVAREGNNNSRVDIALRYDIAKKSVQDIKNATVLQFDGLLTDFCKEQGASVVIRGIRTFSDFEYEKSLSEVYRLTGSIESLFLISKPQYSHISGTVVRSLASLNGDLSSFVVPAAQPMIKNAYLR